MTRSSGGIALLRDERLVATEHGRGTYANTNRSPEDDSEIETQHRQVAADSDLAALFAVEVGTPLIEQQDVTRTDGAVRTVTRVYRLLRASQ